jgi:hypothetical protein
MERDHTTQIAIKSREARTITFFFSIISRQMAQINKLVPNRNGLPSKRRSENVRANASNAENAKAIPKIRSFVEREFASVPESNGNSAPRWRLTQISSS